MVRLFAFREDATFEQSHRIIIIFGRIFSDLLSRLLRRILHVAEIGFMNEGKKRVRQPKTGFMKHRV